VRRAALVVLTSIALVGSACGGGSDKNDNAGTAAVGVAAKVCDSRSAVAMASKYHAGASNTGAHYDDFVSATQAARDAAPPEIKGDFDVLVGAYVPFFELMANAHGDYLTAARDPQFSTTAGKLSSPSVTTAAANVNAWFAAHC
jgi:hypothetical protein